MAEAYLELSHISKMELFVKIVKCWKPLTIFSKSSILYVWLGSQYSSVWHVLIFRLGIAL